MSENVSWPNDRLSQSARAEIVRAALQELHHVLAGARVRKNVKFLLDREAERLLPSFDRKPKLPSP